MERLVEFLRRREYKFVKELGQGACGQTVLLYDVALDMHFVCKKYAPSDQSRRDELFNAFINEIKLLYKVFDHNVVRIYNHYIYPTSRAAYIVMEYVEGEDVDKYILRNPQKIGSVFSQAISAFRHLEQLQIIHRDIRPANVLVRNDGVVKVIDFGFGKEIVKRGDFNNSVDLNWGYSWPLEFDDQKYSFSTEVYFVGKMFERVLASLGDNDLAVSGIVEKMVQVDQRKRPSNFRRCLCS